jgi:hypothetical protein
MATTPRKTFPELTALSAPVVDSDVLALYRSPGPAKRTTATTFADYLVKLASSFIQAGTGAVSRTVQGRMRDTVSVFDFIPVAEHAAIATQTSTYDATAAIQAAINTGKTIEFPEGLYKCAGLTVSTNSQRFIALGNVLIFKNANGPILSGSASYIQISGISFRGESASYTGDNLSFSGESIRLINCGSRDAAGRAVKSIGNQIQIYGTCDIYSTADVTATGYDIEVGVSGTATLYHELHDIYSSTATGGIKFVDCGSQTVIGGQFGKLTIAAGTSPAGTNGGKYIGARILGNVTVDISNAVFTGNQFGGVTFTIGAGTSGLNYTCNLESTGFSMVNNGVVNQFIFRHDSAGTGGRITYQYGPSSSLSKMETDVSNGDAKWLAGKWIGSHGGGLRILDAAGTGELGQIFGTGGTNLFFNNATGGATIYDAGQHQFTTSGTLEATIDSTGLLLASGNALYNNSIKVVGAQGAAVADATGGIVIDAEARTALNALLARLRTHGLIAT